MDRLNDVVATSRSRNFIAMSIQPAFAIVETITSVETLCAVLNALLFFNRKSFEVHRELLKRVK